jgi:uncharacterized protein
LLEAHGMLPHIREHSLRVLQVARHLGEALNAAGTPLYLPLIEAGALLHDLGKTPCLGTGQNHARWGALVLTDLGYPELAEVVEQHVHLKEEPWDPRPIREAAVVNYADKRVLHTRVVTLRERFLDLRARYGLTPEILSRLGALELKAGALEDQIFRPLSLTPDDLLALNDSWRNI